MKKFMMYVVVLVTLLFVGYTTYYFCRNNETISLTLAESETIFINVDESYDIPIAWDKPYKSTQVYENVSISNPEVVSFNQDTRKFVGLSGGVVTVTVTPSNEEFGPFVFDIHVGDGSTINPYYISSAEKIQEIGAEAGEKWQLYHSYQLISDINLYSYNENVWTPVGTKAAPFTGSFNGNGHVISNINVTSGEDAGLFGVIGNGGLVENVIIDGAKITGEFDTAGAVAGTCYGKIGMTQATGVKISNTKAESNNGGIVGLLQNVSSQSGAIISRASVEMSSVNAIMESAGNVGGLVGKTVTAIIFNSKAVTTQVNILENTLTFGGLVGLVDSYTASNEEDASLRFNIVKNNLVVTAPIANTASATVGMVVGNNLSTANEYENRFVNIYYQAGSTSVGAINSAVTVDLTQFIQKSYVELEKQATYVGWNFDVVWTIEEDKGIAEINFQSGEYVPHGEFAAGDPITTVENFKTVLSAIKANPSAERTYVIEEDIVYDLEGDEWTSIGTESNPLKTSIIAKDGAVITIKNVKLTDGSFFGYVSGSNTMLSGFVFENVTYESSSTTRQYYAILSEVVTDSTLENMEINGANIIAGSGAEVVGMAVAINRGRLENIAINKTSAQASKINVSKSTSVHVGGVVGRNNATVNSVEVSMLELVLNSEETSAKATAGGIVGYNMANAKLINSYNYDAFIKQTFLGELYVGGVAGLTGQGAIINSCFSKGLIELNITNESITAGGITAILEADASIIKSFYAANSIKANKVAGLVATNNGKIDQCYFEGDITGEKVGGLVYNNNKTVTNCYVTGAVSGYSDSSVVSGVASKLAVGSSVENCFSTATFGGKGKWYAEAEDNFRAEVEKVLQLFDKFPDVGALKNCIVINYGKAEVHVGFFGWVEKYSFIECNDDQAKGISGDYSVFKNDAGFDQVIWTFERGEAGAYPTLTYVVVDPTTVVEDAPVVE